jgi:hypothetical protein
MTAVRIVDSLKYGAVLLGYFLVIAVVGIGGMALGGALALPELESLIDDTSYETAELVGGSVLGLLGFAVWTGGLFALAHKLIADSVARGQADVSVTLSGDGAAATRTVTGLEQTANGSTAQQRTESAASQQPTADHTDAEQPTATGADHPEEEVGERGWSGNWSQPEATERPEGQPERSAEEIAFGGEGRRSETEAAVTENQSASSQQTESAPADEKQAVWESKETSAETTETGEQSSATGASETATETETFPDEGSTSADERESGQSRTAADTEPADEASEAGDGHSETANNHAGSSDDHTETADDPLADRNEE